jgi:Holliday junction resolvase RusA-like endonuclease
MYKSREAHEYKETVQLLLCREKPSEKLLEAYLFIFFPTTAGDCDNRNKIVYDSCEGRLYLNDRQIKVQQAFVSKDAEKPRVELFIRELEDGDITRSYLEKLSQL